MLFHYQTLVAGLVGFLGVIISILANGYLARKQERAQRFHEKDTILAALRAELKVNLATIKMRSEQLSIPSPSHRNQGYLPILVFNDVYKSSLHKIGVLEDKQAEQVIKMYLLLEELPTKMQLLSGTELVSSSFVLFSTIEHRQHAAAEHKVLVDMLKSTLAKIA
ncbi:hypothetical protein ACE1RU_003731 [Vibrio mimicus]